MDKTTLGLIAAMSVLAATPAVADARADSTDRILKPQSVAELLEPVSNPVEALAKLDAARQLEAVEVAQADVQIGPFGVELGRRRHHHHHHFYRHHHHHHHHHHQYYRRHHHHHHYNNY